MSCERVFRPDLKKKPVIVLSNNDGCIVSRSQEAKKLGIKNGKAVFKYRDLIKKHKIISFSSNYPLYADFSGRVFSVLKQFSRDIENYSVDESFLEFDDSDFDLDIGYVIKERVEQWTGIPVSIGFGPTKALAKVANYMAKKTRHRVYIVTPDQDSELKSVAIKDLWGVGRQSSNVLRKHNINNVYDFKQASPRLIRKKLQLPGLRLQQELRGIRCHPVCLNLSDKKQIISSRSFGNPIKDRQLLLGAITENILRATKKLRDQRSLAGSFRLFIQTSRFKPDYYSQSIEYRLMESSQNPIELCQLSKALLEKIFIPNLDYKKSGVILSQIVPENSLQTNLFRPSPTYNPSQLTQALDKINNKWGRSTLVLSRANPKRKNWRMNQNQLSPRYTTVWEELKVVN